MKKTKEIEEDEQNINSDTEITKDFTKKNKSK